MSLHQVVPSNVEKHILTHPAVHDAGVVGLPHEVDGELPLAFVVVKDGCSVSEEEIVQYIAGNMLMTIITKTMNASNFRTQGG